MCLYTREDDFAEDFDDDGIEMSNYGYGNSPYEKQLKGQSLAGKSGGGGGGKGEGGKGKKASRRMPRDYFAGGDEFDADLEDDDDFEEGEREFESVRLTAFFFY